VRKKRLTSIRDSSETCAREKRPRPIERSIRVEEVSFRVRRTRIIELDEKSSTDLYVSLDMLRVARIVSNRST